MRKETRNKIFAVFILLAFIGSTIAYAISFIFPKEKSLQLIYDKPLSESEEATYLRSNFVILRFYYSENCCLEDFKKIENVFENVGRKMIIEKIEINKYLNETKMITDRNDFNESLGLPYILLRGKTEKFIQGKINENELFELICSLYFEDIDECSFY
ncbi:MAG: hypothetical protein QXF15_00745 [Candidatus Aenigmatarchaeota archaeon]|nr:hypothetical protein [Candidatus Aenigmarchaeota archaeon]